MKLLGNQQNRFVHRTLESIANNDPNTVNVVLNGFAINETKLASLAMSLVNNEHVKSLYLQNTGINPKGANLLAFALRSNKTLEHLSLNDNIIGSEGCAALAAALHENHTLISLGLSNNGIADNGAKKIVKMLKENHQETSISRIFIDGNDDISEKIIQKIDRYCLKACAKNLRSSCNKSHASTSPCSEIGSHTSSKQYQEKDLAGPHKIGRHAGPSKKAEIDLFKEVIGYESTDLLHTSLNASNLASYIERVHKNEEGKLEDELGPEYFSSDIDFGTSFLSTASDKQDFSKGRKKDKHGYFRSMKWPSHRKVHNQE
jgi:hypothetical protein